MTAATATSTASTTAAPAKVAKALQKLSDIAAQLRQLDEQQHHVDTSLRTESMRLGDRKLSLMTLAYQTMMDRDQTTSTKVVETDFKEWAQEIVGLGASAATKYAGHARLVLDQLQEFAPTEDSFDKASLSTLKLDQLNRLKDATGRIPKATLNEFASWCHNECEGAMPALNAIKAWVNTKVGPPKKYKSSFTALPPTMEARLAHKPALRGSALLGLGFGSADDIIKLACRHFRQQYHPDKNNGDSTAYDRINAAVEEVLP